MIKTPEDLKPGMLCKNISGLNLRLFDVPDRFKRRPYDTMMETGEVFTVVEIVANPAIYSDPYPVWIKILSSTQIGWLVFSRKELHELISELEPPTP